jgi:hypothetical protein
MKKIFISSTGKDLAEYREVAISACLQASMSPIAMEAFLPDPKYPAEICRFWVGQADIFLGIIAHRYGHIPDGSEISLTEMEYDRALELNIPIYLFVMNDKHPWPPSEIDKGEAARCLERFKARLLKRHTVRSLKDLDDFGQTVSTLLTQIQERTAVKTGCPTCGEDWVNFRGAKNGPQILQGGSKPLRKLFCPNHNLELFGWDDLMERSIFFDEIESEYVIWSEDPTEKDCQDLQMPPNSERIDLRRGADGRGEARFRFNQAEIVVKGRVIGRGDVLLKHVVDLPRSANVQALPVNGEEAACVDWKEGGVSQDTIREGFWNVRLRGGWHPFGWKTFNIRDATLSEEGNVTLLLWPGFDDPRWKAETVVYHMSYLRGSSPRVRCYGAGPRKQSILGELRGLDRTNSMLHLQEQVKGLEFRSLQNEPLGYLWPTRRPLYPGQVKEAIIALDFGTSNTVIAWKASNTPPRAIAMDQDAPPVELLAPTQPNRREEVAEILSLLPFWPRRPNPRWRIPSQLLFLEESGQWTIPNDYIEPDQLESLDIRNNFKWIDNGGVYRHAFLRVVLRMALSHLRFQGIETALLRATYPSVFHLGNYGIMM